MFRRNENEIERLIMNIFFTLTGKDSCYYKDLGNPRMSIEDDFTLPEGKIVTDILVTSKEQNYAFFIEIKQGNEINTKQLTRYLDISFQHLKSKGIVFESPSKFMKDITFCTTKEKLQQIKNSIESSGEQIPTISLDLDNFRMLLEKDVHIKIKPINSLFLDEITFDIKDWNEIREFITYSLGSSYSDIIRVVGTYLSIKKVANKDHKSDVSSIAFNTYIPLVPKMWNEISAMKRNQITGKIENALISFRREFPNLISFDSSTKDWKLNVHDGNGKFNQGKANEIREILSSDKLLKIDQQFEGLFGSIPS